MTILGSHQIIVIIQHTIQYIIVHFIDIQMFYIKYLAMHKVQMHAGVISNKKVIVWFVHLYRR